MFICERCSAIRYRYLCICERVALPSGRYALMSANMPSGTACICEHFALPSGWHAFVRATLPFLLGQVGCRHDFFGESDSVVLQEDNLSREYNKDFSTAKEYL